MFKQLCGEPALKNVVIVTNRWGEVRAGVGETREAQLISDEDFYKLALDKGARKARHVNPAWMDGRRIDNALSAEETIAFLLENTLENPLQNTPLALHIQDELVTQGKKLEETDATGVLDQELQEKFKKYEREQQELWEIRQQEKDEETRKEIEIEIERRKKEDEKNRNERNSLEADYKKDKEKYYATLEEAWGKEITIPIFHW